MVLKMKMKLEAETSGIISSSQGLKVHKHNQHQRCERSDDCLSICLDDVHYA